MPVESGLRGTVLDDTGTYPDVAVGASGTIIERGSALEPIGDFTNPPSDLDGDGLYEDITGDVTFGEEDAQALYDNLNDSVNQDNASAFDFNGDGKFDVSDVQKLYTKEENQ